MSNRKYASSKPFFLAVALFFAAIIGLGFFRFNASQLEYHLSGMERSIELYSAEEMELKQVLSGLTSPIKIYSYCKDQLGMSTVKQEVVHVVPVPPVHISDTPSQESRKGWRSSIFSFFGLAVN